MYFVSVRILQLMKLRLGKTGERDQVRRTGQDSGVLKQFGDGGGCETLPGLAGAGGKLPDAVVDPALEKRGAVGAQNQNLCSRQQQLTGTNFLAQLPCIRSNVSH
ncbi:hypothetical protein [Paenarthrobacter sp. PH39-S1]|uniref:hypothetical protein n=1 Tax=Paenarthrobacter sp. PH39-S1 TaxID=3046204 RepID=UPI0024BA5373|nr:hypothetical protein [Paenarthrobacter sp. PH39-S1]MDJ0358445.1 hypothetical protein [Paenarthrobacter sp. PH39-S1]